mmetsp:Transcript_43239/g.116259  ORF Transcript_43239/g.116259 Transcript_43239/m.116259 type:complete len:406 (+) Transcript_43239:355-1572(+)
MDAHLAVVLDELYFQDVVDRQLQEHLPEDEGPQRRHGRLQAAVQENHRRRGENGDDRPDLGHVVQEERHHPEKHGEVIAGREEKQGHSDAVDTRHKRLFHQIVPNERAGVAADRQRPPEPEEHVQENHHHSRYACRHVGDDLVDQRGNGVLQSQQDVIVQLLELRLYALGVVQIQLPRDSHCRHVQPLDPVVQPDLVGAPALLQVHRPPHQKADGGAADHHHDEQHQAHGGEAAEALQGAAGLLRGAGPEQGLRRGGVGVGLGAPLGLRAARAVAPRGGLAPRQRPAPPREAAAAPAVRRREAGQEAVDQVYRGLHGEHQEPAQHERHQDRVEVVQELVRANERHHREAQDSELLHQKRRSVAAADRHSRENFWSHVPPTWRVLQTPQQVVDMNSLARPGNDLRS